MHLAAGLLPDLLGGAITLPRPASRYKGEGREGKERVGNRGRNGVEGKDVKGWEEMGGGRKIREREREGRRKGMGREGSTWIFIRGLPGS